MDWFSPWINTTERCNCRCEYCFVKQTAEDMQPEVYQTLNRNVLAEILAGRLKACTYRLGGGEPTLVTDQWFDFVDEFLSATNGPAFRVEVLTNLVKYPEHLDVLVEKYPHRFNVDVSLDGIEESKPDCRGVSTAHRTIRNLLLYMQRHPEQNTSLMTVVTNLGVHLRGLAEFVSKEKLGWYVQTDKTTNVGCVEEVLTDNLVGTVRRVWELQGTMNGLMLNGYHNKRLNGVCFQGSNMCCVGVDGTITNCQMQMNPVAHVCGDFFCVLADNPERAKLPSECDGCYLLSDCGGKCPCVPFDEAYCRMTKRVIVEIKKFQLREVENA